MQRYGIERQALAVALIPVLILAVLVETAFLYYRMSEQDQGLLDRAELIARQLAASSEYAVFAANGLVLQQLVNGVMAQKDVQAVQLLDADGKTLATAGNAQWSQARFKQQDGAALWQDDATLIVYQPIVTTQLALDDTAVRMESSSVSPVGAVQLTMSKRRLYQAKRELVLFSLLLTAVVLLLSVLAAMIVARRITQPIFGMHNALRRLGEGKLDTRISEMSVIELNELAQGINEMAQQIQYQQQNLQSRIEQATQALREKKEEAEKANYDKTRFLAAASHDLRQPMHALGLFMGELHHRINTAEQRQIVDKVDEAVTAMSGLLESLLDISKLDAGVVVPQLQEIDIAMLVSRLQEVFAAEAAQKYITFRVRCHSIRVVSDPILLERILLNLLGNAIRYTPPHGTVLLACRRRGKQLRIETRDNGNGIAEKDQERIFHEFVQLENAARERSKGLGLGLPIVQRLCRLLQHSLALRSAPGAGTTFSVDVPLAQSISGFQPADSKAEMAEEGVEELGNRVALVVDDDELVRTGTGGLLESWGWHVRLAKNLAEVKAANPQLFDLVICDYRLPDGNGLELFHDIQTKGPFKPAFILISGDTFPDILQQVATHGLHLLHKPVRPAKLRSLLNSMFKQGIQVAAK